LIEVISGDLSSAGRLFHVRGPLTAKLRWPVAVRVRGTSRSRVADAVARSCWRPCTEWAGTHRSAKWRGHNDCNLNMSFSGAFGSHKQSRN